MDVCHTFTYACAAQDWGGVASTITFQITHNYIFYKNYCLWFLLKNS